MSNTELNQKVRELKRLKARKEEINGKITAIEDEIKAFMQDVDEIKGNTYKITYKPVTSPKIDTKAIKNEIPEIAIRYTVYTTCKRLVIS